MTNAPPLTISRRAAAAVWLLLCGYWVALAIGTHLPPSAVNVDVSISDKAVHAAAYFVLGLLAATAWRLTFGRFHRLAGLALLLGLAAFGAVDEVTQPYFHRNCDAGDWAADVVGAAIGLVLFRIVLVVLAARRGSPSLKLEADDSGLA